MIDLKKLIATALLSLLLLPAMAQQGAGISPAESRLSLRANLLRWASLTPDLGLEWRINPSWGILVSGSWTAWSWSNRDRRYALWEVMPEARRYVGKEKRGYFGAMFKTGELTTNYLKLASKEA